MRHIRLLLIIVVSFLFFSACSTVAQLFDQHADYLEFSRHMVRGTEYTHIIYRNAAIGQGGTLHVYLDGDGTPWLNHSRIASDPTPRNPLVLRLMAQDRASSLYLGRPCYHGQSNVPPCSPLLWTARRYGPEVVDSMAAALTTILARANHDRIVFIGYSGGGTLAMLLAERFKQTRGVLTVAGNLNPVRWTALHGYSPLTGSLDPAVRPSLSSAIVQLHFVGALDQNIPEILVEPVVSRQRNAVFISIKDFDHTCCWEKTWLSILNQLELAINKKN